MASFLFIVIIIHAFSTLGVNPQNLTNSLPLGLSCFNSMCTMLLSVRLSSQIFYFIFLPLLSEESWRDHLSHDAQIIKLGSIPMNFNSFMSSLMMSVFLARSHSLSLTRSLVFSFFALLLLSCCVCDNDVECLLMDVAAAIGPAAPEFHTNRCCCWCPSATRLRLLTELRTY